MSSQRPTSWMDGITLYVACIVGLSLLATALPRWRQSARSAACEMNLKQLGLAFHNYHSAYRQLPMGSGGTSPGSVDEPLLGNANRLSPWVGISPFMEQQALWEQISNPMSVANKRFPAMGPVPWYDFESYPPWKKRPQALACPADSTTKKFPTASSYVVNYGDAVMNVGASPLREMPPYGKTPAALRGMFGREMAFRFRDVLDGLSNTLMVSEAKIGGVQVAKNVSGMIERPTVCIDAQGKADTEYWPEGRTACWADGSLLSTGVQTILPPNSPSATSEKGELEGVLSASSHHGEGAHVLIADGSVRFASQSIDVGDQDSPTVAQGHLDGGKTLPPGSRSPFGVWGALGTRAAKDRFDVAALSDPVRTYQELELAEFAAYELETWHAAKGTGKLQARQIDLSDKGVLTLMSESGDIRRLGLSRFASQDAYRAVETHRKRIQDQSKLLLEHLATQLDLLEDKQFETFVREWMVVNSDDESKSNVAMMAGLLKQQRGAMITKYDQLLELFHQMDEMTRAKLQENLTTGKGLARNFQMQFVQGKWKVVAEGRFNRAIGRPQEIRGAFEAAADPFGGR
ncbi:DUF1559 domain-containing protein [Rhodopirellula halodulae]|uniref:DUF1559 domain-containing protein n=1 Tax=Rhodopirellula halodulae TaxID=2894198 RepID=UPI001E39306D|nr:DUF1559 domain-containing protein [Rhodopirellula sp. JC737]MCC9654205.1 DUF1559 domain-containing protein [Rhodopirellula sp. JC737]